MGKSDYLEQEVLKACFALPNAIPAAGWASYIGLFTVAPTDAGGGTEVSGGAYARQATAGKFSVTSSGATNTTTITFPTATSNWGTVVAYGLFTVSSGGTMLRWQALPANQVVNTGTTLTLTAGKVTVTEN